MTNQEVLNKYCDGNTMLLGPEAVRNQDEIKCPECGGMKAWDEPLCEECEKQKGATNMKNEMIETPVQESTPASLIRLAVEKGGIDLEKLEKVLGLQERYEANEARKLFALDFASVQAEIESVCKTKINPQTHSKYADLADVIESAKPIYTQKGFSVIFYEGDTVLPEQVRLFADVLHCRGHKETYHFDVPLDGVGIKGNANMTKIHGKASSISYGRRYLMCMIWNIPTQDNDGQSSASVEYISEQQLHTLRDMLLVINGKEDKFLTFLKVETLEMLPATDYQKAVNALNASKAKKGAEQ